MPLILAPGDDGEPRMPNQKELERAAEYYFDRCERTIYETLQNPTQSTIDDHIMDAAHEAIELASAFPNLIEKSYKLMLVVEEAFSAAKRRQHWLKLYTRICLGALNGPKANDKLTQTMVRSLFTQAGSAMVIQVETDKAIDLLNQAIDFGLDVESKDWFLAKATFLEAAVYNKPLNDTVAECAALLKTARDKRDELDMLENPDRHQVRRDYYEAEMYVYTTLAFAYMHYSKHYKAFVSAQQAFIIAREIERPRYNLLTAPAIVDYYRNVRGNNPLSTKIAEYCLDLQIPVYAFRAQALLHMSTASHHYCSGRYRSAEHHYKNALLMMYDMKDRRDIAILNHGYGLTLMKLNRYVEALDHTQKAIEEYKTVGLRLYELDATYTLAWIQYLLGQHSSSLELLNGLKDKYAKLPDKALKDARLKQLQKGIHEVQSDHNKNK